MTNGLKPYPKYTDSGSPWLGRIPAHWNARRIRQIVDLLVSNIDKHTLPGELPVRLCNYTDVYKHERITNNLRFMRATATPDEIERFRLRAGDVLLTKDSEEWTDIGVPSLVEYTAPDLVCGYHLAIIRCRSQGLLGNYVLRALQCPPVAHQFHVEANGVTRYGLSHTAIKNVVLPVPPGEEQPLIVRYLDHASRRIERYVHAKRKLIALLNEQKQAIIHRAVTRGLDPSVPLRPSGIPWLVEFPEHWKWIPMKRLLSRMDYGTSEASTETGIIRILTMGNIQKGEVIMPRSGGLNNLPDSLLLEHHDLLFTRTNGNPELVGKVGIFRGQLSDKVSFASYLVRLRVKSPHDPQWLHMLLNSSAFWPFARSHALVNLQTNLNSTRYGQFPVPVPPPSEQVRMVEWVVEKSKALNSAIFRLEGQIELLREYRSRLIADVVTGQLDVREAAARLPEETQEPEMPYADYEDAESIEPEGEPIEAEA